MHVADLPGAICLLLHGHGGARGDAVCDRARVVLQLVYVPVPGGKVGYTELHPGAPVPCRERGCVWSDDYILRLSIGDLLAFSIVQQSGESGEDPGDVFVSDFAADGVKVDVFAEQHIPDDYFAVAFGRQSELIRNAARGCARAEVQANFWTLNARDESPGLPHKGFF